MFWLCKIYWYSNDTSTINRCLKHSMILVPVIIRQNDNFYNLYLPNEQPGDKSASERLAFCFRPLAVRRPLAEMLFLYVLEGFKDLKYVGNTFTVEVHAMKDSVH